MLTLNAAASDRNTAPTTRALSAAPLRPTLVSVAASLILAIVLGAALFAWTSYRARFDAAAFDLDRLDAIMTESTTRTFDGVDLLIRSVLDKLPGGILPMQTADELSNLLHLGVTGMPMVLGIVVADESGAIRFNSRPGPGSGRRIDDREHFRALRDAAAGGLYISAPVTSRVDGTRVIVAARRITLADGSFGGIVAVALRIDYFERLYAAAVNQEGGSLLLLRTDGTVLARHPALPEGAPNPPPSMAELMRGYAATGRTLLRIPGPLDGMPRLLARRRLPDTDLAIAASISEETILAPWWRELAIAISLAAGAIGAILLGLRVLLQQISRSEQASRALQDSETELRLRMAQIQAIYDGTPIGLALFDRELRYVEINAHLAAINGHAISDLLGQRLRDRRPEIADRVEALLQRVLDTGEALDNIEFLRDDAGVKGTMLAAYRPVRDRSDTVIGVVASVLDISELRRAQEAQLRLEAHLHESDKLRSLGQLTGGLAHDFNNLLMVIIGNLDLLDELRGDDTEIAELALEARTAAGRGAELTRSLLAFARKQPLHPQPVDVNELVESTARLLSRTLGERIEVRLDLTPQIAPVVVDRAQLEAALTNLATNARDAMTQGGRLVIATAPHTLDADYAGRHPEVVPGDYVMIAVADSGTGMSPEVRAQIFEPFFTTKKPDAGTGLGLSMVFGFVKQSGGHIDVYSEPGLGTTFRLYLPVGQTQIDLPDPVAAASLPTGGGKVVLMVDDDAAIRRVVVRQLAQLGYDVLIAEDAAGALALLGGTKPIDLLFTDVVLAGKIDGVELATLALERRPAIRIVLTSGFPNAGTDLPGIAAHLRLLSKPYSRAELAHALDAALHDEAPLAAHESI
jgi:PAS domain S-box-containing protein